MTIPIRRGGVYLVADQAVSLPPNTGRVPHARRYVIVISGDANTSPEYKHVLVVPTSSSGRLSTEFCVKLAYGTGNLPSKCWARVVMPQPIAKADLESFVGQIPAVIMETIENNLLAYLGMVD